MIIKDITSQINYFILASSSRALVNTSIKYGDSLQEQDIKYLTFLINDVKIYHSTEELTSFVHGGYPFLLWLIVLYVLWYFLQSDENPGITSQMNHLILVSSSSALWWMPPCKLLDHCCKMDKISHLFHQWCKDITRQRTHFICNAGYPLPVD